MPHKSTIVRFLRPLAKVGGFFAPRFSGWTLERLFLTPIRHPTPHRETDWMANAGRSTVWFDDTRRLPVFFWGEGPTVLLVHGWSGRGSQMAAFARPLVERGFRVVTFDAPGHGEADGGLSGLPEITAAVEKVAEWAGPIHGVVAHSLGTAATSIAVSRGLSVERLVYVAPPENPGDYLRRAAHFLGFGDAVARRARARIERRFSSSFDDARAATLAGIIDVPLLVVHDRDDADVPHEEGIQLAEVWGAEVLTTHGLGHQRVLRDGTVVEAVVGFLSSTREQAPLATTEPGLITAA